jgi:hypothetical protein
LGLGNGEVKIEYESLPKFISVLKGLYKSPVKPHRKGREYIFVQSSSRWHREPRVREDISIPPEIVLELRDCLVSSSGKVLSPDGREIDFNSLGVYSSPAEQVASEVEPWIVAKALTGSFIHGLYSPIGRPDGRAFGSIAFGHWLIHRMPKIHSGLLASPESSVLTSPERWDSSTLIDSLGLGQGTINHLNYLGPNEFVRVEKLILSSQAASRGQTNRIVDWQRLSLMADQVRSYAVDDSNQEVQQKIYLTRTTTSGSRKGCINRNIIEEQLRDKGFFVIAPETLSFREQVNLLSNARHIVSEAGSAGLLSLFTKNLKSFTSLSPRPKYSVSKEGNSGTPWDRHLVLPRRSVFRFASIAREMKTFSSWIADETMVRNVIRKIPE